MKYLCDPHVLPTVVPSDLPHLIGYAQECAEYAEWIQVDIVDGVFAPNTTWPYADSLQKQELENLSVHQLPEKLSYEAHLMVHEPTSLGERLARAGFRRVIGHIEAFEDANVARAALDSWRSNGAEEAGLAILLDTPLSALEEVIDACDCVLAMTIATIGKQGIPFDDRAFSRIEELHAAHPDMMVAVDGGVSEATVESLVRAGANRLSVGSAISKDPSPKDAYARILDRAQKGCIPETMEMPV